MLLHGGVDARVGFGDRDAQARTHRCRKRLQLLCNDLPRRKRDAVEYVEAHPEFAWQYAAVIIVGAQLDTVSIEGLKAAAVEHAIVLRERCSDTAKRMLSRNLQIAD